MEDLRFDGEVVIVTGAARGLGLAYASFLAKRGAAVVVNDLGVELDGSHPTSEAAEHVATQIRDDGGEAVANSDSVASPDGAARLVRCALDAFGRIDVVINNAGVHIVRPFVEVSPDIHRLHVDVHLGGTFFVTQAAWPHLAAGAGRVVNTTSNAVLGLPGLSAYGPPKAAIIGLTRTLAVEGSDHGIRVNAISPSAVTRMVRDGQSSLPIDARTAEALNGIGTTSYVAPVVAYLAHRSCSCTGEVIFAGRGRVGRVVLAETAGIQIADPSPELIAGSIEAIVDESQLTVLPDGVANMTRRPGATAPW